jgi:transposase
LAKRIYYGTDHTISRRDMLDALAEGGNVRAAALELGCSYGTAINACRVLGIGLPKRGPRSQPIPKARLLKYRKGYSWAAIAEAFDTSITHVRNEFKRHKIIKRDERSKNANYPCGG